jgi:hypothetical protein
MNLPAASGGVSRLRCGLYEVRSGKEIYKLRGLLPFFCLPNLTRTAASGGVLNPTANKGKKIMVNCLKVENKYNLKGCACDS